MLIKKSFLNLAPGTFTLSSNAGTPDNDGTFDIFLCCHIGVNVEGMSLFIINIKKLGALFHL